MFTRHITVRTTHPNEIPAYLYSHTVIEEQFIDPQDPKITIFSLTTTANDEHTADYLVQYQADRLNSGWHWSTVSPL